MSEENKTVELKDEDLEKVDGGFSGNDFEKPTYEINTRVRVRKKDGTTAYGIVVGLSHTVVQAGGGFKDKYFVAVQLDGYTFGKDFAAGDVELA